MRMSSAGARELCELCERACCAQGLRACAECSERMSMFVRAAGGDALAAMWPAVRPGRNDVEEEQDALLRELTRQLSELDVDAGSHVELARSYLEMGMGPESAIEALAAMRCEDAEPGQVAAATTLLMHERLGGAGVVERMRAVLRRRGWC
jgi:hypothetical protein